MSVTFTMAATLKVVPKWIDARGVTDITDTAVAVHTAALDDGYTDGRANAYWRDEITISAGSTVTIELYALQSRSFGGSGVVALDKVKVMMLVNRSGDAVTAFGSSANRWSSYAAGAVSVASGGVLYATTTGTGWQVSGGSKTIAFTNAGAASAVIDVYIVGVLD